MSSRLGESAQSPFNYWRSLSGSWWWCLGRQQHLHKLVVSDVGFEVLETDYQAWSLSQPHCLSVSGAGISLLGLSFLLGTGLTRALHAL